MENEFLDAVKDGFANALNIKKTAVNNTKVKIQSWNGHFLLGHEKTEIEPAPVFTAINCDNQEYVDGAEDHIQWIKVSADVHSRTYACVYAQNDDGGQVWHYDSHRSIVQLQQEDTKTVFTGDKARNFIFLLNKEQTADFFNIQPSHEHSHIVFDPSALQSNLPVSSEFKKSENMKILISKFQ